MSIINGQASTLLTEQTVNQLKLRFTFTGDVDTAQEHKAEISTYKKMRRHPQIALGMAIKSSPIRSLSWKVTGSETERVDKFSEELGELWNKTLRMILTSWAFGFQTFEKIYELEQTDSGLHFKLKKLKDLDPEFIEILYGPHGEFLGIKQKAENFIDSRVNEVFLPPEKVFLFSNDPEWGNLRGVSLLSNALKDYVTQEKIKDKTWVPYLNNGAVRTIIGRCPMGETEVDGVGIIDNVDWMTNVIKIALGGGALVIPRALDKDGNELWTIELLEDKTQRIVPMKEAVMYYDVQLMRALLIPDRVANQEGTTGSFGLVQKLVDFFITNLQSTVKEINEQVNRFVLQPWERINYAETSDLKFELKTLKSETIAFLQNLLERTLSMPIGIEALHDRIDWPAVFEQLEIPENPSNPDDTIAELLEKINEAIGKNAPDPNATS